MKKELEWFSIDGSFGGNQDRMENLWMKIGGCAALAAADSCIFFTRHKGFSGICPVDASCLSWESYNRFAETMRPYLSPRMMGVNKLRYYVDGFGAYLWDKDCNSLTMEALPMGTPVEMAADSLKKQIDAGLPVPILHLNPKNRRVKDYRWHWFMLVGYEETEEGLVVTIATYGQKSYLNLKDLWNEDDPENGGLILYRTGDSGASQKTARKAAAIIFDRTDRPRKVLAIRMEGEDSGLRFPEITIDHEEDPEKALELAFSVSVSGLMAVHEYDDSSHHVSERCYKAVLPEDAPTGENLVWLSDSELETAPVRSCDLPLINIIRSAMADMEALQKRIAEEEAKDAGLLD